MSKNVELKAYYPDLDRAREVCSTLGARLLHDHSQQDTYLNVASDRLKIRESSKIGLCIIHYRRLDAPSLRESLYTKIELHDNGRALCALLSAALGVRRIVEKHRETYALDGALINLDTVKDIGSYVEIEVDVECHGRKNALEYATKIKQSLGIKEIDIVPWSYSELTATYHNAAIWRDRLTRCFKPGELYLIDGPSGSGKSTIATRLAKDPTLIELARRHCTRSRRLTEENEYIFVSSDEFATMARAGEFLEYRNFEFGMSYGLAWNETLSRIVGGKNVLAIINWGNAKHVRLIFPNAKLILVTASQDTLRRRLISRGIHNSEQLEERLTNAKRFAGNDDLYDTVIHNEDGQLERAIEASSEFVANSLTRHP